MISSRTPEGEHNQCPVCGATVSIEHSILFGDATCPQCGVLLWFYGGPQDRILLDAAASISVRESVIEMMAKQLGVEPREVERYAPRWSECDSLDTVELVMAFEEFLDENHS